MLRMLLMFYNWLEISLFELFGSGVGKIVF